MKVKSKPLPPLRKLEGMEGMEEKEDEEEEEEIEMKGLVGSAEDDYYFEDPSNIGIPPLAGQISMCVLSLFLQ